jgi:RNA polymerase sigma-54 factor
MNLSWRPQGQLAQAVTINAQVIQSIKLLQFSHDELGEFIKEQCERNPLLESPASCGVLPATLSSSRDPSAEFRPTIGAGSGSRSGNGSGRVSSLTGGHEYRDIEERVAAQPSLRDHLRMQLGAAFRHAADAEIAVEIIESLDDDGYLRRPLHAIADALGHTEAQVETVLLEVQNMDPPGVGARNLAECLKLQLRDMNALTPALERLLANLHLLAAHDYRQLASLCGVGIDEVVALSRQIKRLDPRPGRRFERGPIVPALPDVDVRLLADGSIITELNQQALPRLLINRQYYSEIKGMCRAAVDTKFVHDCMKEANWLVRNLDQRARTILKVATEVMARQSGFLRHGVEHLKPMNLKDVAEAVGIHPSTVCRAIANKYIMTPRGLYELKFFFANAVVVVEGQQTVSTDTVRHRIRQMITSETVGAILSDDAIVRELRDAGVDIARRTVAKYREAMNIPSSLQRRRQKEAELAASRAPLRAPSAMFHAAAL